MMRISIFRQLLLKIVIFLLYLVNIIEKATSRKHVTKSFFLLSSIVFSLYIISSTESLNRAFLYFLKPNFNIPGGAGFLNENYPIKSNDIELPEINLYSALIVEKNTNKVLYEYNGERSLPPASTTKLMTALISLDLYDMDEILAVPEPCTLVESSKAGLPSGAKFTVESLLNALLIQSAGDAACTLAISKISYWDFLDRMNIKAQELGMADTKFSNPIGLDGNEEQIHYSTARDLYKLTLVSTSEKNIEEIIKKKTYTIEDEEGDFTKTLYNTNKLLWEIPNTVGVKTGTTLGAGEVLIYEYQSSDKDLVIIVMGSTDRFFDTRTLLSWVLRSYIWKK